MYCNSLHIVVRENSLPITSAVQHLITKSKDYHLLLMKVHSHGSGGIFINYEIPAKPAESGIPYESFPSFEER